MRPIIITAAVVLITAAVIVCIVASQRNAHTSAAACDQGRGKVKVSTTTSGNLVITEAHPCQR